MAELAALELPILEALAEDPALSQRALARRANLSLGRVNFVLRRLIEKGQVKLHNAAESEHKFNYLYLLTPEGLEAKAKLTVAFLHRSAAQYQAMVTRVDAVLEPALAGACAQTTPVAVAIAGQGPLAEVVRHRLHARDNVTLTPDAAAAHLVVVTDPAAAPASVDPARVLTLA